MVYHNVCILSPPPPPPPRTVVIAPRQDAALHFPVLVTGIRFYIAESVRGRRT
jgi:hypothetical protein